MTRLSYLSPMTIDGVPTPLSPLPKSRGGAA